LGWTVIATHRRDTIPDKLATIALTYPRVQVERMDVAEAGAD
jgi:hypothetical protein